MNKSQRRIVGWACIIIGASIAVGMAINAIDQPSQPRYGYVFGQLDWSGVGKFFRTLLLSPIFYAGLALAVVGMVILKGDKKE